MFEHAADRGGRGSYFLRYRTHDPAMDGFPHRNHLRMIELLFAEWYPEKLADCKTVTEGFALLRKAPFMDPLAYQYATNLIGAHQQT
jgi:hypothetical protein